MLIERNDTWHLDPDACIRMQNIDHELCPFALELFRAFQFESFLYRTKETREECLETDPFSRYFFKEL